MDKWFKSQYLSRLEFDGLDVVLELCINKQAFAMLYTVDKDWLIGGICIKIKEYFGGRRMPFNEDTLADMVGPIVEDLIKRVFIGKNELDVFLKTLGGDMLETIKYNPNQKLIEEHEGRKWK